MDNETHYDTLGISAKAPPEVVTAAYKAMSRLHHPDVNGSSAAATQRMALINAAYAVLSDLAARSHYDYTLRQQQSVPRTAMTQAPPQTRPAPPTPARPVPVKQPYRPHKDTFALLLWLAFAFILYDGFVHGPHKDWLKWPGQASARPGPWFKPSVRPHI